MTRRDEIKKLIQNNYRRLQLLKEQKALAGWSVDPKVNLEMEDIETEIEELKTELSILEPRMGLPAQVNVTSERVLEETDAVKTPRILVIDDEPDFLDSLCLSLHLAGYRTVAAMNGAEAISALQERPVDLIISDISMPQLNGYQLFNRVCDNPEWVSIPFIFLTARTLDSDIYFGKELGVDDYLTKPIRRENLLSVVRGKLCRRRAASEPISIAVDQAGNSRVGTLAPWASK